MKILITGGSGFIGKAVIQKLSGEVHVMMALSRSASLNKNIPAGNVHWIESSLCLSNTSFDQIKEFAPEAVLHLAWEKIPDFSFETSFENLQNHISFFNRIFTIGSVKKVVVTGSCWEYNKSIGHCIETENCESANYFTWAKNALRDFLQFECRKKNIDCIWSRLFFVYGPGQRSGSLIPAVIKNIQDGEMPELKKPANANDFIYLDDVADGLIKMIGNNIPSGVYNLGTGKSTSVIEMVRMIESAINNTDVFTKKIAGNSQTMSKEVDFWADMHKTTAALNWQPAVLPEDGITRIINCL